LRELKLSGKSSKKSNGTTIRPGKHWKAPEKNKKLFPRPIVKQAYFLHEAAVLPDGRKAFVFTGKMAQHSLLPRVRGSYIVENDC
jgi:uracil-DNA glycosylase